MEINTNTLPTSSSDKDSDSLDIESQQELAGFNPNKLIELESEYKLNQDNTSPSKPPVASQGVPRTVTILLLTGGLLLSIVAIWTLIKPGEPTPKVVDRPPPEPEKEVVLPDETAKLKTQLALIEQDKMMKPPPPSEESPEPEPPPEPPPEKPKPTPIKTTSTTRPAPPPPPPRPVATRSQLQSPPPPPPPPLLPPQRAIAPPEPQKLPEPTSPPVNPYQRWQQLQTLGFTQSSVAVGIVARNPTDSNATASKTIQTSPGSTPEQNYPEKSSNSANNFIKTVTVGMKRSPGVKEMTTGEQGIINRQNYTRESEPTSVHAIAFGTSASGTVKVPLIWDEGSGEQLYSLFAIALDKPIQGTSGEVALPANTVIIAQAETVGRGNRLVQASAIALVYSDLAGNVKQEAIAPGAIIIRGQNLQPLIARGYYDHRGAIASQDLLISLLSGLGEIGEVFTEPEQSSSFSTSSSNSGSNSSSNTSSTIIRSREPQIWSAVLKGFFNPLAERISSRNDAALNELLSRPNIAVIDQNTQVTLVVNSFLKIKR